MCTAIFHNRLFGRNLDLEYGYEEQVVIMPRNYPLIFRQANTFRTHHAIIGMAAVDQCYPLYFDAMNERGLCMAGLDFPDNAYYPPEQTGLTNIAPFELIPWVLCQCSTTAEAKKLLQNTHLANIRYSADFPQAPLHWIIADQQECIVLEPTNTGLQIYDNPVGVLCNNPPFPYHLHYLTGFQHLSAGDPPKLFENVALSPYSGGMGAVGLPGDFSSPSRFIKAAFVKSHAHFKEGNEVTEFFHLLDTVAMPRGSVRVRKNKDEITRYSCCCDIKTGCYYYTTYDNRRIQAVSLQRGNLDHTEIDKYTLLNQQDIFYKN